MTNKPQLDPTDPKMELRGKEPAEEARAISLIERMRESQPLAPVELDERGLIHRRAQDSPAFDGFRDLRTRLLQIEPRQNFSVLVTSVLPGGGASYVAANLAAAFALDRARTALLLDCNLVNPSLHERFKVDLEPGLTDFLADPEGIGVGGIIRSVGLDRLRLVTAGTKAALDSEWFASQNLDFLLRILKQRFPERYLVIDAPSMKRRADARMLTSLCDLAVLVVPYGRATRARIEEAIDVLGTVRLAGIVLNRQPRIPGI